MKPKKIFIATSRPIGEECIKWAKQNTPTGFEIIENLQDADILISVLYDRILKRSEIQNKSCFNFHPGVLPEYKGVGINSWVIINNEIKTGATLHVISEGVDAGDIIEIREFMISNSDTAYSLFNKSNKLIHKMFKDWYHDLLNNNYNAVPQKKNVGVNYRSKDLQRAKNLTRYAKAFHFPGKEGAYFYNDKSEKIYIEYSQGFNNETN